MTVWKVARQNKIRRGNRNAFVDVLVVISEKVRTITSYKNFLSCWRCQVEQSRNQKNHPRSKN